MPEALHYLRLLARVRPDNTVRRVRTQVTERANRSLANDPEPAAWAELSAADGRPLLRWPVTGGYECVLDPQGARLPDLLLRAHIPLPADARSLRLTRDGAILTEIEIGREPPAAELTWPPEGLRVASGRHAIPWRSGAQPTEAFLRYSADDGRTWHRIGARSTGTPFAVDFDALPGGESCRLALVVTAAARSTTVVSQSFPVSAKSPEVTIIGPTDGAVIPAGTPVFLEAAVVYRLGEPRGATDANILWRSDRDGGLGSGQTLFSRLSPGTHHLEATFAGMHESSARVTVEVRGQANLDER